MCDIASEDVNLSTDTEDELLQLSEDSNLKLSFKGKELKGCVQFQSIPS